MFFEKEENLSPVYSLEEIKSNSSGETRLVSSFSLLLPMSEAVAPSRFRIGLLVVLSIIAASVVSLNRYSMAFG